MNNLTTPTGTKHSLADSPSLIGLSGAAKLKELMRLKKLQAAATLSSGGVSTEHIPQAAKAAEQEATISLSQITQKIRAANGADMFEGEKEVSYNKEQQAFIDAVLQGKPVALSGPAGSGKTTSVKGAIKQLIQSNRVGTIRDDSHKHLEAGRPAIACVAFTNKAVENMKKVLPHELRSNCITIHKLLEYGPVFYDKLDESTGQMKKSMEFLPKYDQLTPLLQDLEVLIIDEASMVAVDLWNTLAEAIHHDIQIILIGDIQQLPPVFGKPIFIYALQAGITKVELVEVHRQALESPIISLAHKILAGTQIFPPQLPDLNYDGEHGKLVIKPWKKVLGDVVALKQLSLFLPAMIESGDYDPMQDMILTPFNVNFGTIEINKIVANYLIGKIRKEAPSSPEAKLHEIVAGIKKVYLRLGEKVLYNKTEHIVRSVNRNTKYFGKPARASSVTMDYNGFVSAKEDLELDSSTITDVDAILDSFGNLEEDGKDRKRACSHIVTLYSEMLDQEVTLETGSEVGGLELAYAITVHKSQGSEYPRVLFITHHTQSNMFFRELVYTGVTRAKRELVIICPPNFLVQGINTQKLPGKNLDAKIEAFDRACAIQKGPAEKPLKLHLFDAAREVA